MFAFKVNLALQKSKTVDLVMNDLWILMASRKYTYIS